MSYQVIARKYRPRRFSDVVGQEHVTQTLSNAIRQERVAHAYLFVGPRGTGKTTIARIFAKCLNCTGGPKVDFDDADPRVQEITDGRSLDVFEIDGASNRGIEEIRALRETVKFAPASSRFKIYIIDEVHMLTKEAFNALLKTLEEPPAHVKFFFATTEPEKVLATILSRCQRYDLRRIPTPLIVQHLGQIAKLEQVEAEEAALRAIARGADGCMRDAESTLDQLISFCPGKIVESDVLSMFGLAAHGQILALARAVLSGHAEGALRELNELSKHGKDLGRLLGDLMLHFRNLLLHRIAGGDSGLLEVTDSEAALLSEQAKDTTAEGLTRIMGTLTECETRMREAASKKILLEVYLLRAIQVRDAVSIDTVLKKLQDLRAEVSAPAPNSPATVPARPTRTQSAASADRTESHRTHPTEPDDSPPAPVRSGAPADLERLWTDVVEGVGRVSPFTRSYLLEAHPVSFANSILVIGFDPEFASHLSLVDNTKNRTLIQTKMRELGFAEVQVKFVEADAPFRQTAPASSAPAPESEPAPLKPAHKSPSPAASTPTASPPRLSKEDFLDDPLIRQALEVFKGQIVEVHS